MEHEKLMAIGRKLLDKHGLHDWGIEVRDERTKRALTPDDFLGYRDPSQKQIVVYRNNDLRFRQAVLHQIAHVLTGDDDHTMRWIRKAKDVGLPDYYVSQHYPEAFVHEDADETSPFYHPL
jgi:hypothetical protein